MTETVTRYNPPEDVSLHYSAKGVENSMTNHLTALQEGKTRWTADVEFKMAGMMKVMAFLMPKMFRTETEKTLKRFKEFAEGAS